MSAESAPFVVFGFAGTHDALKAEEVLLAGGADVVLIPTPKALGSLCGFAVRVSAHERTSALELLSEAGIAPDGEAEIQDRVPQPH